MPTYSYACTECDHRFDAVQSFTDANLTECPTCSGRLRKLFNSVGIVFKGSGFYRNDSRTAPSGDGAKGDSSKDGAKDGARDGAKDGANAASKDGAKKDSATSDGKSGSDSAKKTESTASSSKSAGAAGTQRKAS